MASHVDFVFQGIKIIIQCQSNEKMKDICNIFREKAGIANGTSIIYCYDGKVINDFNQELSFDEIANSIDKERKIMDVLVYDNMDDINNKNIIIQTKNIICPICQKNMKIKINNYELNLYDCENDHKINDIPLKDFCKYKTINI